MRYLLALLCAVLVSFSPGCASTADKTALNVEIASRQSLTFAWNTFRAMRAQGKISDQEWKTGAASMDGYKRGARAFLTSLEAYEKNRDAGALNAAIAVLNAQWQPLYEILVKYYPTLTNTPPTL